MNVHIILLSLESMLVKLWSQLHSPWMKLCPSYWAFNNLKPPVYNHCGHHNLPWIYHESFGTWEQIWSTNEDWKNPSCEIKLASKYLRFYLRKFSLCINTFVFRGKWCCLCGEAVPFWSHSQFSRWCDYVSFHSLSYGCNSHTTTKITLKKTPWKVPEVFILLFRRDCSNVSWRNPSMATVLRIMYIYI